MSLTQKIFFASVCLLAFTPCLQAQFSLAPNHNRYDVAKSPNPQGTKGTPLELPFFDDFSSYQASSAPNDALWLPSSGAWINQCFGINPVSYGVATLDGLRADGSPYSFSTVVVDAVGLCDVLTSNPINLSALSPIDQVFLSFYWQEEGYGERPDLADSLSVEFLDNTNKWQSVWRQEGGHISADFKVAILQVDDNKFFHENFQFRFLSYGRQSGMYDAWHVDYVYMNKNRHVGDTFVEEIATSKMRNRFLKKYTAMPSKQYFANPTAETSDKIEATINNLSGVNFDVVSYRIVLEDAITNTVLADLGTTPSLILQGTDKQITIGRDIPANPLTPVWRKQVIRSKVITNTGDGTGTIPPVDLRTNDIISSTCVLGDYLAYDDGSAEYGAGVNQRSGKVAIRFHLHQPDTLTDIQFMLTKFEKDLSNQTFNLIIWQHLASNTPPNLQDLELYKMVVPVRYPANRDELLTVQGARRTIESSFNFPPLALPAGEFYIGWEQTNNDRILMGYDRNTNSSSEIFFNVGNGWAGWEPAPEETGSLLFRPVFGDNFVLAREAESRQAPFKLYPNPAQATLYLEGNLPKELQIIDLQGKVLATHTAGRQDSRWAIPIESMRKGLYLLRATMPNGKTFVQKWVKE